MGSHLELLRPLPKHDLFLCHVIGTPHAMPTVNRGSQAIVQIPTNKKNPCATGTQQPFMGIRCQKIDVLRAGWKSAHCLNGIEAEEDVPFAQRFSDSLVINPVSADEMAGSQSDQGGGLMHLPEHIAPTGAAERT